MYTPTSPLTPSSLAERIAWMHEPVHLTCDLPWWLRRLLEMALHRMFCTLEQGILTLLELQRQGKLEPWPDAAQAPQISHDKKTSAPAASRCRTGGTAVPMSPKAAPGAAPEAMGAAMVSAPASGGAAVALPTTWPRRDVAPRHAQGLARSRGDGGRPRGRYGTMKFSRPAETLWDNCA